MASLYGLAELALLASALGLGTLAGALLTEGVLLIPYWRSLPAEEFFRLHKVFAPRLYGFFAPLTIFGSLVPVMAAVLVLLSDRPAGKGLAIVAAGLSILMLVIYLAYFKAANARFAAATISAIELRDELGRWNTWHWVRVIVAFAAFGASVTALTR